MTPPKMDVEGQTKAKVCRESIKLCRKMMINTEIQTFALRIKKDDVKRTLLSTTINMYTFFISFDILSFFFSFSFIKYIHIG